MSARTVSPGVTLAGDRWTCAACGQDLAPSGAAWKDGASRRERPLAAAGAAWETGDEAVVLRHFYCPACARLLDTETAMPDDPSLADRLA